MEGFCQRERWPSVRSTPNTLFHVRLVTAPLYGPVPSDPRTCRRRRDGRGGHLHRPRGALEGRPGVLAMGAPAKEGSLSFPFGDWHYSAASFYPFRLFLSRWVPVGLRKWHMPNICVNPSQMRRPFPGAWRTSLTASCSSTTSTSTAPRSKRTGS